MCVFFCLFSVYPDPLKLSLSHNRPLFRNTPVWIFKKFIFLHKCNSIIIPKIVISLTNLHYLKSSPHLKFSKIYFECIKTNVLFQAKVLPIGCYLLHICISLGCTGCQGFLQSMMIKLITWFRGQPSEQFRYCFPYEMSFLANIWQQLMHLTFINHPCLDQKFSWESKCIF